MNQFTVLIVDDEPRILKFLNTKLKTSRYEELSAGSGMEALDLVQAREPDLVVLDLVMPGMDGFEALRQIRAVSGVPVIILSAKGENTDKITGLGLGADDYLTKPFSPDELVARIEAVRRRLAPDEKRKTYNDLSLGNVTIDFNKRLVLVDNKEIRLTRIEWLLISELAQNAGSLMMYEDLLTRIWGSEYRNDVQILRTWISRLRNKVEKNPEIPSIIRTVPKTGYMIDKPSG
ncbi:MAG: response regulator transcription factor [Dehalococcoidales bacterium]|nr:MAG: response regulator transcription factor [Dehalococcoidales bacterium]